MTPQWVRLFVDVCKDIETGITKNLPRGSLNELFHHYRRLRRFTDLYKKDHVLNVPVQNLLYLTMFPF